MNYKFEWTESGFELLKRLDDLAVKCGSNTMLANYIIGENPEYFRSFPDQQKAYKNIQEALRKRNNPNFRAFYNWSMEEDELIISTMKKPLKEIYKLFPRRSRQAVNTRRVDMRKFVPVVLGSIRYFGK